MFFFWMIMYGAVPALLLPGIFGLFGKEAEEAAEFFSLVVVVALIVVGGGAFIYFHFNQ